MDQKLISKPGTNDISCWDWPSVKRENIAASPLVNTSHSAFECFPNTSVLLVTTRTSRYMARRLPRNLGPYVRHGLVENLPDQSPPVEFERGVSCNWNWICFLLWYDVRILAGSIVKISWSIMDGTRGDDAMPSLPAKLDCILRRLMWLGAPKVPYLKQCSFDSNDFRKSINNLCFSFLGIAWMCPGIHYCCSLGWLSQLGWRDKESVPNHRVIRWREEISKTCFGTWWVMRSGW